LNITCQSGRVQRHRLGNPNGLPIVYPTAPVGNDHFALTKTATSRRPFSVRASKT
jgi:hypothetical protein